MILAMISATDPILPRSGDLTHFWIFLSGAFGGATGLGIMAQAVNTFPVPENKYWAWALGVLQYAVGQKSRAANTFQGMDTVTLATVKGGRADLDAQGNKQ